MLYITLCIVHPGLFPACQNRFPEQYITGNNFATISEVGTAEACWELCLSNIGYICNSIDYNILQHNCHLSRVTSRNEPLVDGPYEMHIERCVDG